MSASAVTIRLSAPVTRKLTRVERAAALAFRAVLLADTLASAGSPAVELGELVAELAGEFRLLARALDGVV